MNIYRAQIIDKEADEIIEAWYRTRAKAEEELAEAKASYSEADADDVEFEVTTEFVEE